MIRRARVDETRRLAALGRYATVDGAHRRELEDLARLAAQVCDTPIAAVTLVGDVSCRAMVAVGAKIPEHPRQHAFCAHTILGHELLVAPDTILDPRFAELPAVVRTAGIRFYAGAPLVSPEGASLGALCVMDTRPRDLEHSQRNALEILARQVMAHLDLCFITRAALEIRRYEDIVHNMQVGLYVFHLEDRNDDASLRLISANPASTRINGLPTESVVGRTVYECFPALVGTNLPRECADVVRTGLPTERPEIAYEDDRVALSTFAAKAFPLPDDCVGVAFEDFSSRKRAEEALRDSEERFRALAQSTEEGVAIHERGVILEANARLGKMLGCPAEELVGLPAYAFASESDRDEIARRIQSNDDRSYEIRGQRRDGSTFPMQIIGRTCRYHGRTVRVTVLRDVSEQHRLDQLKDDFISTVSHELRTPLTSIRGSIGLLEAGVAGELAPGSRELVRIARVNTDRLIRLINDFLDLEKMSAGKLELRLETLRLGEIATTTMAELRPMADQAGVRLKKLPQTGATDLLVRADRDRLAQVFTNLVSNAIKFSPEGGTVTISEEARPAGWIRATVSDQGPGVPDDKRSVLFGKFQQIHTSDSRRKGGTGLGLAICKAIVEQHGGRIGMASAPNGKGASFFFELPTTTNEVADAMETSSAALPGPPVGERLAAMRRQYGEALPGRVDDIAAAVESTRVDGVDGEALSVVLRLAHRLHGSGGTYGFPRVGEAASHIEGLVRVALENGGVASVDWGTLSDATAALRAALAAEVGAEDDVDQPDR